MRPWILFVLVTWNVTFSKDGGTNWVVIDMQYEAESYGEAQQFVDMAPKGVYECWNSVLGYDGLCKLSEFRIGGVS